MNKSLILFVIFALIILIGGSYFYQKINQPETAAQTPATTIMSSHLATIQTNYGEIQFQTYDSDAPKTVQNFIDLAQKGFYDGLTFHRVINSFMIQAGDPNCTPSRSKGVCGTGGPGYKFADELNPNTPSYQAGYQTGVVAMANSGPNTNGSQFFIMLKDTPLPHDYTIFGKVVSGQNVVDSIGNVQVDSNARPLQPVIIEKVSVSTTTPG